MKYLLYKYINKHQTIRHEHKHQHDNFFAMCKNSSEIPPNPLDIDSGIIK